KITSNNVRKFYPLHKDSKYCTFTVYESTYKKSDGDIEFEKNRDRFNSNGLKVTIEVPEEYYSKNLSEKYSLVPQMTLTSDGILILEIYHDGKLVGSNKINI
ncbi:MAG: hypothetical protein K2K04_00340, partial [Clostridia bacterium]|nr:hypothetical protein [Clostridia bacterium]